MGSRGRIIVFACLSLLALYALLSALTDSEVPLPQSPPGREMVPDRARHELQPDDLFTDEPGAAPGPAARPGEDPSGAAEEPTEGLAEDPQGTQPLPANLPSPILRLLIYEKVEVRPDLDPVTRREVAVAPGRPDRMEIGTLVRDGLSTVKGVVEISGTGKPEAEQGVPVSLTGRVMEKENGKPVRGAEVVLHSVFYLRRFQYDHHLKEVARVETDADGEYRIDRLNIDPAYFGDGGLVFVSVSSPDHASKLATPLKDVTAGYRNRLADLVISRERHTVRGRVLDQWEGKPVVGGRVVATGLIQPIEYPKDQREALFLLSPEAVTDEEGRFVLEGVGAGNQMLTVHGGNDCAGYQMIRVPHAGELQLRTRAIRGRIEGRVLDADDRPVALVRIDGGENTTHTFANGTFVLENFRGDVVTLTLTHPDFLPRSVPGTADGTKGLVLRMDRPRPVVVFRVRDRDSLEPVVKVSVLFEPSETNSGLSPLHLSATGYHSIRLPEGATKAVFKGEDEAGTEIDLTGVRTGDTIEILLD